eukprot:SAG11_NODE_1269_length_5341_cov_7.956696_1_plen_58_part_00
MALENLLKFSIFLEKNQELFYYQWEVYMQNSQSKNIIKKNRASSVNKVHLAFLTNEA